MADSIGIMEGAFFVSKNEILNWVNEFFNLNMTKIEEACTGALHCQIIDACHPGKVKMSKVKWNAKHEHEFVSNFKILQQAFIALGIKKHVEVDRLVKGKYMENLEFCQWIKKYFDLHYNGADYDAEGRRNGAEIDIVADVKINDGSSIKEKKRVTNYGSVNKTIKMPTDEKRSNSNDIHNVLNKNAIKTNYNSNYNNDINISTNNLKKENDNLKIKLEKELKMKEFYFNKLNNINKIIESNINESNKEVLENIQTIIYEENEA